MDKIQTLHAKDSIRYNDLWLYFVDVAKCVIDDCKKMNIAIHGMEAFRITGNGIQPDSAHSLWFKDKEAGNWESALSFLNAQDNLQFVYEVWYEGYN